MNRIECPKCGQIDSIQKVSSIVSSGTSSGTFSGPTGGIAIMDEVGVIGSFSTLSGSSKSELARLLTPPPEPVKKGGIGCAAWFGLIVVEIIFLFFTFVLKGIATSQFSIGISWFLVVFLLIFFSVFSIIVPVYGFRQDKKLKITEEANYAQEKINWDRSLINWNRSYYCFRDDIVFDPETGKSCPPQRLFESK